MIALIQRVLESSVTVEGERVAKIGHGLLVLLGVEKTDQAENASRLVQRLLHYRVFSDAEGKMNRSLLDIEGELLVVPQFTLAADTRKGRRPSFSSAAGPDKGRALFDSFCQDAGRALPCVQKGIFGADMKVGLVNDGPVTFWLKD